MADRSDRELTLVADTDMIDIIKTIRFLASHLQLPEAFSLKTGRLQTGNDHWSHPRESSAVAVFLICGECACQPRI